MRNQLASSGVQFTSVSFRTSLLTSILLTFEVILSSPPSEQISALNDYNTRLSLPLFMFDDYQVQDGNRGSLGIIASGESQ